MEQLLDLLQNSVGVAIETAPNANSRVQGNPYEDMGPNSIFPHGTLPSRIIVPVPALSPSPGISRP